MEKPTNDSALAGERIIGLDLLRILSMLMVILLLTARFFILFLLPWFCILRGITAWKGLN